MAYSDHCNVWYFGLVMRRLLVLAVALCLVAGAQSVPVIFDTTTNAMPLIKSGKVRALAIGTDKRLPDLPNVPTFAEAGYPDFHFSAWYAMFLSTQ